MKLDASAKRARDLAAPYRVSHGASFRLKSVDPDDTGDLGNSHKPLAKEILAAGVAALSELQSRLYAQDSWAVLLIFQAMDAAGKDSAIKHVMSGINPQGCQVFSFKAPSNEELDHDYLWRCQRCLPERGRIGIFNRSYYEEVLVVRVHRDFLARQKLPAELLSGRIWKERHQDIRNFERYLGRNGVALCKFFLHVSLEEQKRRFLERLDKPEKNWKFAEADVRERALWPAYMKAYEDTIRRTATDEAPWYVVPADNKWFTRLVVVGGVIETLSSLGLKYPTVEPERKTELEAARAELRRE